MLCARTLSEERGFMEALIATGGDQIRGFVELGELLAAVEIAKNAGLSYTVLRKAVITHPPM